MSTADTTDTPVILTTGLFDDQETLAAALQQLEIPDSHRRELHPKTMNDGDWDDIINLVLSTTRVITL